jgi:hypothetical protein
MFPLGAAPRVINTKYVDVVQTLNTPLTDCWTRELKAGRMDAFAAVYRTSHQDTSPHCHWSIHPLARPHWPSP